MDRACEGGETRQLVSGLEMTPVVPPKANRKAERDYDRETCKFRKKIERLFRRFKGCKRLFTRFDKLDATFPGFASLAAVFEMTHDLAWTGPNNVHITVGHNVVDLSRMKLAYFCILANI